MRLSSLPAAAVVAATTLALGACTSDLPAPNCYSDNCQITGLESATAGGTIAIDCTDIPNAALMTDYDYTPMISGGDEMYTIMANNLPMGLTIDSVTGQITGIPAMMGPASVEIVVTDSSGGSGSQICEFEVNNPLSGDYDLLLSTPPFCVRLGETLNDYVIEGTGDGTPIVCETPGGSGNGDVPEGITVNPDTCEIEGTLTEDRFGTYVWIVRGTQSGQEVFMPYCVTQDEQAPDAYDITVDHSGLAAAGSDGTLVPIVRRFDPTGGFDVGGMGDPRFEVVDPTSCGGNSCFYGFAFGINASPFDVDGDALLDPNELLNNMSGEPIGFFHELQLSGPNPTDAPTFAEDFGNRPWLVNIAIDYCINEVEAECMGSENIRGNGNGSIEMAVVMIPN